MGKDERASGISGMIYVEVDYQGDRSIETYSFTSTDGDYQAKLNEIEAYPGSIDEIKIYADTDKVSVARNQPSLDALVKTTHVASAIRRGRQIIYPSLSVIVSRFP